jgi:hypothetical protein
MIKNKISKICIISGIVVLISLPLSNYYKNKLSSPLIHHLCVYEKKPFKPTVKFIKRNYKKADIIAHTSFCTIVPFWYYWQENSDFLQHYFVIPSYQNSEFIRRIVIYFTRIKDPHFIDLTHGINGINFNRIWLISSSWLRKKGILDKNSRAVRKWMRNHYTLIYQEWMDGLLIELYKKQK